MKLYQALVMLTVVLALGFTFGGGAAVNANKTDAAPAAAPTPPPSNPDLDFDLVNKTGYSIKKVYLGPASTKDWTEDDEILKGRTLANGATLEIKFHPKLTAKLWDLKVDWSDGSPSDEWLKLNLTKFDKLTLKYDKATDTTTAIID